MTKVLMAFVIIALLSGCSQKVDKERNLSFVETVLKAEGDYISSRKRVAICLQQARELKLNDSQIKLAFIQTDFSSEIKWAKQGTDYMKLAEQELNYIYRTNKKLPLEFHKEFFALRDIIANHSDVIQKAAEGFITSDVLAKWIKELEEADDLIAKFDKEFSILVKK